MTPRKSERQSSARLRGEVQYLQFNQQCRRALIISLRVCKCTGPGFETSEKDFDFLGSSAVNARDSVDQMCHCAGVHVEEKRGLVEGGTYPGRAYPHQRANGRAKEEQCGMKGALAWVRRHGRTNVSTFPRFLLSRAGFGFVNPAKDPSQSPTTAPVPLSLARARDLSQAFRRLNGLKRHTGAHLPVTPNPMHLRARRPFHLASLGFARQVKRELDCTHVGGQRAAKSIQGMSSDVLISLNWSAINFNCLTLIIINISINSNRV